MGEKIMDGQLDYLIAEKVMGWTTKNPVYLPVWMPVNIYHCEWRPTEKIEQAWQVQEQIDVLGLRSEYIQNLSLMVAEAEDVWWFMATATPRQRCEAAIMTVEKDRRK